jgi:putative flippase GtrA
MSPGMLERILSVKFARYVLVACASYSLLLPMTYVLTEYFGVYYFISYVVSFLFVVFSNFMFSMRWTFRVGGKTGERFARYLLFLAAYTALNFVLVRFLTEGVGVYYLVSITAVTGVLFLAKYYTYKTMVFQEGL